MSLTRNTTVPYRDPALPISTRVEDLMSRMTLADKAGMLFHDIVVRGTGGALAGEDNYVRRRPTEQVLRELRLSHLNLIGAITDVAEQVRWYNAVQEIALDTPLGIPVTLSTDPRHSFTSNPGAAAASGALSRWPESLGLAALRDAGAVEEFAGIVRQEYLALGLRVALHPQADLATEPRWARIAATFGEDAELASSLVAAYIRGLHGTEYGATSVSTVVKHFPGGGPQKDGEDPHFAYGREQLYSGGRFEYHLAPFRAAIEQGVRQVMPYYGVPIGTDYEEIAFGFNRGVLTELLRGELGFDGIVLSDFGIISDATIFGQFMPARAWGAEHLTDSERVLLALTAGVDQFGGEARPELVIELVESGRLSEERVEESVRRILADKFALGLFESPFLDLDEAREIVGRADFVAKGRKAQGNAVTRLTSAPTGSSARLPLVVGRRVYTEGIVREEAMRLGDVVDRPEQAEIAVLRLGAPFEPRPGGFERHFHAGSLEFSPVELARILSVCRTVPTIVVVFLDRPAIVPEISAEAAAFIVDFGAADEVIVDVLLGRLDAHGRLPLDMPSSTAAVLNSPPDAPFDTADPVFRFGNGL